MPIIGEPTQVAGYQEFEQELKRLQGEVDKYVNERHAEIQETARANVTDYLVRVATNDAKDDLLAKLSFLSLKPQDVRRKLVERWQDYVRHAPSRIIPSGSLGAARGVVRPGLRGEGQAGAGCDRG